MKIERIAPLALALAVLLLSGCVAGTQPVAAGSTSSASTPAVTPTTSASDPDPNDAPAPALDTPEPVAPMPATWSDDELIGACKVAWNDSGRVDEWSQYSPDAVIQEDAESYYVAFINDSSSETRACDISGTPAEPSIQLAS